jgi:MFS-type transporter involved in bile tolerance (Atg22 family)
LFVIGIASTLITKDWHLSSGQLAVLNSTMLAAAFLGVFLFPVLQTSLGLRGTLLLTAGVSVAGFALTLVLPEPSGRSLEDIAASASSPAARSVRLAARSSVL